MPRNETVRKAKRDAAAGKAPSTQAGEFVHEEIDHVRNGKHGVRSTKQAIAIGLSKARRAGVKVGAPKAGSSKETKDKAARETAQGSKARASAPSPKRSRATTKALKRESTQGASHAALSSQARASAERRGAADRSRAAKKAAETKGPAQRSAAAKKAVRTRSGQGEA